MYHKRRHSTSRKVIQKRVHGPLLSLKRAGLRNTRASGKEGPTPGSDKPGQQARVAASNEGCVPQWPYFSDNEAANQKMLYYGELLHEVLGCGWFKYRVDGGNTREAMEKLAAEVELWVCHTVSFDTDTVEHFR